MGNHEQSLPYGSGQDFNFNFPAGLEDNVLQCRPVPGLEDFRAEVLRSLDNPLASVPLQELLEPGQKVVIAVNDITRLVKSEEYMPVLVDYLNAAGIPDRQITILIATGTHRPAAPQEVRKLLGPELADRLTIASNLAENAADFVLLGTTSRGTPVKINRLACEADHVILTGGINFHYLAGFSGGRKSVLPGMAALDSIRANHSLVLDAGPQVAPGLMDGNPVAEDMLEAAAMLKPSFLANVVLNEKGRPAGVFAGHWEKAHRAGCEFAARCFGVRLPEQRPLVIASAGGFPKDINLYQAFKGLYNGMQAVTAGGTVIFAAQCCEGIGDESYFQLACTGMTKQEKQELLRREFSIASYAGYVNGLWPEKAAIRLISDLPPAQVEAMGMEPYASLDEALRDMGPGQLENSWIIPHAGVISLL